MPVQGEALVEGVVTDLIVSAGEIRAVKELDKPYFPRNMTWMCPKQCEFFRLCNIELRGLDSSFIRQTDYVAKPDDRGEQFEIN
jgi:hypothetical protein